MILDTVPEESNSMSVHHNQHNQIYEASSKLYNFFAEFLLQDKKYFNLNSKRKVKISNTEIIEVAVCENDVQCLLRSAEI